MFQERVTLVALVTLLVVIWFHKGLILGSGESGLPFYNPSRLLDDIQSSWSDVPLGTSSAIGYASYPLYITLTFFTNLGVPAFILQASLYWLIFVCGALSIHKLTSLIPGNNYLVRVSATLFYILNPIVHVAVLHRMQYPMLFFYGFIPLAILIYDSGLRKRSLGHLLILSLISVLFSYAFVTLALFETFFLIIGLLSLVYVLKSRIEKLNFYPFLYFILFGIIFFVVHLWWLLPLFMSYLTPAASTTSLKYFDSFGNVETFKIISDNLGSVLSVFRLFPVRFYVSDGSVWGWIYYTPVFTVLSFFFITAFMVSLFRFKKDVLFVYFIVLSLITMFFMKGTLPPFGELSLVLMQVFTPLQVFRNSYEKVGLLLPIVMAIPVGFGIDLVAGFLKARVKFYRVLITIILIIIFPIYMFPIVTGLVFTGGGKPAEDMNIGQYVKVPKYYEDAQNWLDSQNNLFRVLVFPINGEGMTYNWEYGFSGVELSNTLFNQPMISFNTGQVFLPEMVASINELFARYPDQFWVLAQMLNVKYLMVRDDIDYIARATESPATILSSIESNLKDHFTLAAEFGKLKIFEIKPDNFYPKIFASTSPTYLYDPDGNGISMLPSSMPKTKDIFITTTKSPDHDKYMDLSNKIIIKGLRVENLNMEALNSIEDLPFVNVYRGTPFYALVRLKEEIEAQLQAQSVQLYFKVNLLGKRVVEMSHDPQDLTAVNEYKSLFQSVSQELISSGSKDKDIVYKLIGQKKALEDLRKNSVSKDVIQQLISEHDKLFVDLRVKSVFLTDKEVIHRFYTPRDSKYEILISKDRWEKYYRDVTILEFDVDGKTYLSSQANYSSQGNNISLGVYDFKKGTHEVSFLKPNLINLVAEQLPEELVLSSQDKKPLVKTIPVSKLDSNYTYQISFEYLAEKGNVPVMLIHTDVDEIDKKGEKIPKFGIALGRSDYDFGWKKYSAYFNPTLSAKEHNIVFKILPYGDCKAVVQRAYRRYCEDNSFNRKFLRDSTSRIRNLKIEKVFSNPVILREVGTNLATSTPPQVSFNKISSARYSVSVKNATDPYFLVLSTTFNPLWHAYYQERNVISIWGKLTGSIGGVKVDASDHTLINGYANAWYIDKQGDYEMFLEYESEGVFSLGKLLSVIAIILSIGFLILRRGYVKYYH